MSQNQAYLFCVFILTGILIGVLFDVFRILRKSFKTSDFVTLIQDLVFWLLTSYLVGYTVFKFNNGEIRSYIFLGIAIGLTVYILIFSNIFIKINVKIILFLKIIIKYIFNLIILPFKLFWSCLRKIFFKPISFVFINIRKNVKNSINKMSNFTIKRIKFRKKRVKEEGF